MRAGNQQQPTVDTLAAVSCGKANVKQPLTLHKRRERERDEPALLSFSLFPLSSLLSLHPDLGKSESTQRVYTALLALCVSVSTSTTHTTTHNTPLSLSLSLSADKSLSTDSPVKVIPVKVHWSLVIAATTVGGPKTCTTFLLIFSFDTRTHHFGLAHLSLFPSDRIPLHPMHNALREPVAVTSHL